MWVSLGGKGWQQQQQRRQQEGESRGSSIRAEMLEPLDYCALYCRSPNRLRLVNAHPEVVSAVEASLTKHLLDLK